ncbi:MAG: hypothetical protein HKO90_09035 [Flavobacteriaceae bacterium]|nr:hypothetical protein [Flavobacteriaceae bacterium]
MRAQLIISLISLLLIMGCSYEPIDEPLIDAVPSEQKEKAMKPILVHAKENGSFWTVDSQECSVKGLHILQGQFNSKPLGYVKTRYSICMDKGYALSGTFKTGSEDKIYFQSFRVEEDDIGEYFMLEVFGGEGKFTNAIGKIKLYLNIDLLSKLEGNYYHKLEGSISIPQ